MTTDPSGELDQRYSAEGVGLTPWSRAAELLSTAQVAWFTSNRPAGQPHAAPLNFVRVNERLLIHTGPREQKATNLEADPRCALVVGTGSSDAGFDVVVEGTAVQITDRATLQLVADGLEAKYGSDWHYEVGDGDLGSTEGGGRPIVFEVVPTTAYGYVKGDDFSRTRWQFERTGGAQ